MTADSRILVSICAALANVLLLSVNYFKFSCRARDKTSQIRLKSLTHHSVIVVGLRFAAFELLIILDLLARPPYLLMIAMNRHAQEVLSARTRAATSVRLSESQLKVLVCSSATCDVTKQHTLVRFLNTKEVQESTGDSPIKQLVMDVLQ